jgi:hypothetical protein
MVRRKWNYRQYKRKFQIAVAVLALTGAVLIFGGGIRFKDAAAISLGQCSSARA